MKQVHVVAAAIVDNDQVLFTERGYGTFKDKWELPGGKIEEGESIEEAIIREIKEELDAEISPDKFLCTVEYQYETFYLIMDVFICSLVSKEIHFKEHEAYKWINKESLRDAEKIDLLPADQLIVPPLEEYFKNL